MQGDAIRPSLATSGPATRSRGRGKTKDQGDTLILPPGHTIETMKGNSMRDTIPAGALFIVNRNDKLPSPDGLFLLDMGAGEEVRRLQMVPGPMLRVSLDDPVYPPYFTTLDDVHVAGRVVGSFTNL